MVDGLGVTLAREHLDVGFAVQVSDVAAHEHRVRTTDEREQRLTHLCRSGTVRDPNEHDTADDGP